MNQYFITEKNYSTNIFTNIIRNFFEVKGLKILWLTSDERIKPVDFTHSSDANGITSFSTIDHFITDARTYNCLTDAGVIHSALNTSNNSAIYCKLAISEIESIPVFNGDEAPGCRINWAKVSPTQKENYKYI